MEAVLVAEPIWLKFATVLGGALFLLLAVEGLHANLFPRRTLKRLAARDAVRDGAAKPVKSGPALEKVALASPRQASFESIAPAVSSNVSRRWRPPPPRNFRSRPPSK